MYISNYFNADDFRKLSSELRLMVSIADTLKTSLSSGSDVISSGENKGLFVCSTNTDLITSLRQKLDFIENSLNSHCNDYKLPACRGCLISDSPVVHCKECRECFVCSGVVID